MCEYNNKPYWNIVNLCSSCSNDSYITTTTTNIKVEKYNDSTTHLPTAKEYEKAANKIAFQFIDQWSEPKYQCPKCGGGMRRNEMIILTSYPAKYEYQCDKCSHIDYQYM